MLLNPLETTVSALLQSGMSYDLIVLLLPRYALPEESNAAPFTPSRVLKLFDGELAITPPFAAARFASVMLTIVVVEPVFQTMKRLPVELNAMSPLFKLDVSLEM